MVRKGMGGKSVSSKSLFVKALGEVENMWEYVSFNRLQKYYRALLKNS